MRLVKVSSIKALSFSPKRLFCSKKGRIAGSRSDPSSFSYGSSSSSASSSDASVHRKGGDSCTPTSVLPGTSGDWSDSNLEPLQAVKYIGHGSVSMKQLEALLRRLGDEPPSRDEVALMLRAMGCPADDDGACVSVDALLSRVGCGETAACDPAELRETFEFFDEDHDGRITADELLRVFTALGDEGCTLEDCQRMIAEVDKNRDGFVCFEDFAQMMELQR
ncbi:probable calcium-binding protein CML36 [Punica granatum]|uniref:EF-hand domain-containing protein n=2 Tax=Punica granatum TaxID=22663 RepID=A0A218XKG9_PUNGR|nr:probable calcium-binding protein CML36 [Punica granatum]OWM85453.1 hypothetical protein CDL15_Pgr019077 [Punica granatum]PKI42045.1 hypothetical protein CRG98_037498 [Punica granatum]